MTKRRRKTMTQWNNKIPLEELRARAQAPMETCSECGGGVNTWRSAMGVTARILVWMAQNTEEGEYIHVPSAPPGWISKGGDYAKLRYWRLIEQAPNNDPDKRASGRWRLTELGRDFANNEAKVPSHCFWEHPGQEVLGFEDKMVSIAQALEKKFDYQELMNGGASDAE